ncbi:MAG: hypothetical protein IPK68_20220 [Bdellovibrionales bacterium]|nr:hypothetical protein [Bdellovibrionales bacterium]
MSSRYCLKIEKNGSLSSLNQRIYDTLLKVMSGDLKLLQVHTFDGQSITMGDFSYKVVAAIHVGSKNK